MLIELKTYTHTIILCYIFRFEQKGDCQPLLKAKLKPIISCTVQQNTYLYNFRYVEFTLSICFFFN